MQKKEKNLNWENATENNSKKYTEYVGKNLSVVHYVKTNILECEVGNTWKRGWKRHYNNQKSILK